MNSEKSYVRKTGLARMAKLVPLLMSHMHHPRAQLRVALKRVQADYRQLHPFSLLRYPDAQLHVTLDMLLAHYRQTHPHIYFLEVGAYDGLSGDEIYPLVEKHHLCGILVEPQQDACHRLCANYALFQRSDFAIVHAAIAERDGQQPIYRIKPGACGPGWLYQIASFNKQTLMNHIAHIPNLESLIEVEYVRCMTFDTLFKELAVDHVDLLQVDAEGYDATIVELFDVPRRKPAIIRFEHRHLTARDYRTAVTMLTGEGYKITVDRANVLAYRDPQ